LYRGDTHAARERLAEALRLAQQVGLREVELMALGLEGVPDRAYELVFMLLALALDREPLELAPRALASADPKQRGTALEYLEQVIPEPIRSGIWPYLQAGRLPSRRPGRRAEDIESELRQSFG
jgi:hypothetical protein